MDENEIKQTEKALTEINKGLAKGIEGKKIRDAANKADLEEQEKRKKETQVSNASKWTKY